MFAEVYFESDFLNLGFWDQFLWGLALLSFGLLAFVAGPALISRVCRRPIALPQAVPAPTQQVATADQAPPTGGPGGGRTARRRGLAPVAAQTIGNKRKHLRRKDIATPILLAKEKDGGEPITCSVVDRSRGGLGILVDQPILQGTVIRVRPVQAPEDVAWVRLEVRHCGRRGAGWFLGCRFTEQLPWTVILLFG
jgi:hypothetical protein